MAAIPAFTTASLRVILRSIRAASRASIGDNRRKTRKYRVKNQDFLKYEFGIATAIK